MTDQKKKEVAIVVPYPGHDGLTAGEKTSLLHLNEVLGRYDKFGIFPDHGDSTPSEYLGMPVIRTPRKYFGSAEAHGSMMLSRDFYRSFLNYRYVLLYHLDSLVFRDELTQWCESGFDFVGPPWIMGPDLPWLKKEGVGNGGFSLRRVDAFLSVLDAVEACQEEPGKSEGGNLTDFLRGWNLRRLGVGLLDWLRTGECSPKKREKWTDQRLNEDRFWGVRAKEYVEGFRVPPVEIGLKFAFEANPRICFERNGQNLPFGCHAWERYDKEFWEPYLLRRVET